MSETASFIQINRLEIPAQAPIHGLTLSYPYQTLGSNYTAESVSRNLTDKYLELFNNVQNERKEYFADCILQIRAPSASAAIATAVYYFLNIVSNTTNYHGRCGELVCADYPENFVHYAKQLGLLSHDNMQIAETISDAVNLILK